MIAWAIRRGIIGSMIGALVGFVLGFFGPLIMNPENNIGPLAAFATTPFGFFIGLVVGAVIGALEYKEKNRLDAE
jgi:ABC-type antimicrobial peptide transport system permease subunit